MSRKELSGSPSMLPLYLRAALPLVPGLSRVPGAPVPHGKDVPDTELVLRDVAPGADDVAAYAEVCGFGAPGGAMPATYPHVLAFPLHMQLMTASDFPVPAIGLVHIENRIIQYRPLQIGESLELSVRATPLEPHPKGRKFTILTTARDRDGEVVWEDESTNLRRGRGSGGKGSGDGGGELPERDRWQLPGDLGRRYAAVSGDRNPIHLYPQTARLFGFKRAIAHGMWTKARCLAALGEALPDAFAIDVQFRRPVLLPGEVVFCAEESSLGSAFAVRSAKDGAPHLDGTLAPA